MKKGKTQHPPDTAAESPNPSRSAPTPAPQQNKPAGVHSRSHAAHLEQGRGETHSKPVGDLRQGSYPNGRKQP